MCHLKIKNSIERFQLILCSLSDSGEPLDEEIEYRLQEVLSQLSCFLQFCKTHNFEPAEWLGEINSRGCWRCCN